MKKGIFSAVFASFLAFAGPAAADCYDETVPDAGSCTHEFYASYGPGGSLMGLFAELTDALAFSIAVPFTGGKTVENRGSCGPLCLGYNFYFSENFFLGVSWSAEQFKNRWIYSDGTVDNTWKIMSLMGRLGFQYGGDNIKLYHALHAGIGYIRNDFRFSTGKKDSDSSFAPGFHLSLIGIKIGQKQGFNVFADLGLGYLGFVNLGAAYSF